MLESGRLRSRNTNEASFNMFGYKTTLIRRAMQISEKEWHYRKA